MRANGVEIGEAPTARFVTASLKVEYLKPTPIGEILTVRARAVEIGDRKVVVDSEVRCGDEITARGHTVAVRMPDRWIAPGGGS